MNSCTKDPIIFRKCLNRRRQIKINNSKIDPIKDHVSHQGTEYSQISLPVPKRLQMFQLGKVLEIYWCPLDSMHLEDKIELGLCRERDEHKDNQKYLIEILKEMWMKLGLQQQHEMKVRLFYNLPKRKIQNYILHAFQFQTKQKDS